MSDTTELKDHLKHVGLFEELSDSDLDEIAGQCVLERYATGQTIVREGDAGDQLYIVLSGQIAIEKATEKGSVLLTKLRPPACFGEIALFDGAPRSASAVTLSDAELLVLSGKALRDVCRKQPSLYEQFLKVFARRLRQTGRRLTAASV